jgi:hypothetical protein
MYLERDEVQEYIKNPTIQQQPKKKTKPHKQTD